MRKPQTPIIALENAPLLYIPLSGWQGRMPHIVVKTGDTVAKFQCLATADNPFSTAVHSPVSGRVTGFQSFEQSDATTINTVVIENDFKNNVIAPQVEQATTPEQMLACIRTAGIAGAGGAGFPTAEKYRANFRKTQTLIINGVECEPYLFADYALMHERTQALFEGIRIAQEILDAQEIVIAIEEKNKQLLTVFEPFIERSAKNNIRVQVVSGGYPQGSQWQLIQAICHVELSTPQQLIDAGIVVSNVGTIYAIYRALKQNIPSISRIVTIATEDAVQNYEVAIGTPIDMLIQASHIQTGKRLVIAGGPMMGKRIDNTSLPITKGTNGILVLHVQRYQQRPCISCGGCMRACPMHLLPFKFVQAASTNNINMFARYQANLCISCGACEAACPSHIPIMDSIMIGKKSLREGQKS